MLAYKAFNSELQATMGSGIFQFRPGETYEEAECRCARNGFHCAEDPLDVLSYYDAGDTRFFIVQADGDINQDGVGTRISCTRLTLLKEIDRIGLAVHACMYMQRYPERESGGRYVCRDSGSCVEDGSFIIVRGKSPRAAGVKGAWIFLLKEAKGSGRAIEAVYPLHIDGEEYRENTWYGIRGGRICRKKN
ncbi:MAG: hypothetical protein NC489_25515 [Ruminococcus flavefaciens]|nr:hypothetical protein [Ruminococcus flavefaciens]